MTLHTDIAASGLTPALQRGVFLVMLRALFSDATIIRDPALTEYLWAANRNNSTIMIEPVERFDLVELGKRPAILLAFMGSSVETPTQRDGLIRADKEAGIEYRAFFLSSGFEIRCVAGEGAETLHIASEVLIRLLENIPAIKDDYGFRQIKIQGMSKLQKSSEYKDNWVAIIQLTTFVEHESSLTLANLPTRLDDYDIG